MEKLLTTTAFAQAIGASESSVRRWTNSGLIRTARTAGGHRRIALPEAIRFIRDSGSAVVRPELLGLPRLSAVAAGKILGTHALEASFYDALCAGNAPAANACVAGLYLGGMGVASICDGAIQVAMRRIGELWPDDPRAVLIEHRATGICIYALGMLRQLMGDPPADAPVALGGAPDGDPYLLPTAMAGAVLAVAGYHDINYGPETPLELLAVAAQEHKARLVWVSIKAVTDRVKLRARLNDLTERLSSMGVLLVVGGSGVESLGIRSLPSMHVMQTMNELAAFARGAVVSAGQVVHDSDAAH